MRQLVYLSVLILTAGCDQRQTAVQPAPNVEATVSVREAAPVAVEMKPVGSVAAVRPPGAPRVSITVDGALDSQTEPFRLDGGRYEVAWSVTPQPAAGGCSSSLTLKSPDDPMFEQSIVAGIDAKTPAAGTTEVSGVKTGRYYVSSSSNCPSWIVTFTPA